MPAKRKTLRTEDGAIKAGKLLAQARARMSQPGKDTPGMTKDYFAKHRLFMTRWRVTQIEQGDLPWENREQLLHIVKAYQLNINEANYFLQCVDQDTIKNNELDKLEPDDYTIPIISPTPKAERAWLQTPRQSLEAKKQITEPPLKPASPVEVSSILEKEKSPAYINTDSDAFSILEKDLTAVRKTFKHENIFWNPRYKPRGNETAHAVALREFEVSLSLENDQAVDVVLIFHLIAKEWKSIGSDQAPWIHLDFLNALGEEIPIVGSKHWTEVGFDYREDSQMVYPRRLFTPHFTDIKGVRIWLGAGYAKRDPKAPREYDIVGTLVFPIMQIRAFFSRFRRRLERVFWVPRHKI